MGLLDSLKNFEWKYVGIVAAIVAIILIVYFVASAGKSGYMESPPKFERFVGSYENLQDKSWMDTAKSMVVDSGVEKSHRDFVNAQNMLPNAANLTVMEPVDDIQFVGLRRPDYSVPISAHSRTQPSSYQDNLPSKSYLVL